jgi:hypothetical protein
MFEYTRGILTGRIELTGKEAHMNGMRTTKKDAEGDRAD